MYVRCSIKTTRIVTTRSLFVFRHTVALVNMHMPCFKAKFNTTILAVGIHAPRSTTSNFTMSQMLYCGHTILVVVNFIDPTHN